MTLIWKVSFRTCQVRSAGRLEGFSIPAVMNAEWILINEALVFQALGEVIGSG